MRLAKIILVFGAMSVLAACAVSQPPALSYATPNTADAPIDSNLG